jgi:hypothetical protein
MKILSPIQYLTVIKGKEERNLLLPGCFMKHDVVRTRTHTHTHTQLHVLT